MTAAMSEDRLAEIAALEAAATKGPWVRELGFSLSYTDPADKELIHLGYVDVAEEADVAFMADARTAVPELLAEVRRLREAEAARATVRPGSRRYLLLAEITRTGGEWTIGRVKSFYTGKDFGHLYRATMRADLGGLHKAGYLVMHDTNGRRFYTPAGGAK